MMSIRRPVRLLALARVIALALATAGTAFPEPPSGDGVRIMVASSGSGGAANGRSVAAALARSGSLDAILLAPPGVELAAEAARSRCVLAVDVSSETLPSGESRSAWRLFDPLEGLPVDEGVIEGPEPTERDLAEFWWLPLVEAAERAVPLASAALTRVAGAPGTRIAGLGDDIVTLPEGGELELALRVPSTYRWRAESAGAYPESGVFVALERGSTLSISRRPLSRFSVELGFLQGQFPDLWGAWRFAEDALFLRAGFSQFLAGLYLVDASEGSPAPSAFASLPYVQPGLGIGAYVLPPDAIVRPYATVTAFARVILAGLAPMRLDPIGPFGLQAAIGAEWRFARRVAAFLELGAAYYPFCDGTLMAASAGTDDRGATTIAYGDAWFLEYPTARFGARVSL